MRRVVFTLAFLGLIVVAAVAVVVVAKMPDDEPGVIPDPPLPDGNSRGDDLLTWAAEHPDLTHAHDEYPTYLEDL